MVILLTLSKLKINLTAKLFWEKLDAWATFWTTYPCRQDSTLASQTCEGLHQFWALPWLLSIAYFSIVQASNFLIHPHFPTQSVRLPFITYPSLCTTGVTYRKPCHGNGHQVFPTQLLPREAEDFSRGANHSNHMPCLT